MRLNAYVLLAEPEWLEISVASYYPLVRKIIASYDRSGRGWTGAPIRSEECVSRLRAFDSEGKVEFVAGDYGIAADPMANDTNQRREALASAEKGCDWVLQIDTDEVVPRPAPLVEALERASRAGAEVVRFPNRVIRQHVAGSEFLEECTRLWLPTGGTLPLAVRPGVVPHRARESAGRSFRVGLHRHRVDARPGRRPQMAIALRDSVIHLSWVRSAEGLQEKFTAWSHSRDRDWEQIFRRWQWAAQHPRLATAVTPLSRVPFVGRLRRVTLEGIPVPAWTVGGG